MPRTLMAGGLLAAVLVLAGLSPAVAEPGSTAAAATVSGYRFTYVASSGSIATDVNDRGEVTGWYRGGRVFVWAQGRTRYLPTLGGDGEAHAINDRGQVAGMSFVRPGPSSFRAVLWTDGRIRDLGVAGVATGINNAGVIVGMAYPADRPPYAWRWQNGRLTALARYGVRPGKGTYVYDVNDAGQIVGVDDAGAFRLTGTRLERLRGLTGRLTVAHAVNARGDVAGGEAPGGMPHQALLWQGTTARALGTLAAFVPGSQSPTSLAHGIDVHGRIVGESNAGIGPVPLPFLWDRGVLTRLPTPDARPTGIARAINSRGLIVGEVQGTQDSFAAAWIPEPAR